MDARTRIFVEDRLVTSTGFRGTVPLAEAERANIPLADLQRLENSRILRYEKRLGTTHLELSHDLLTSIVRKSRDAREAVAQRQAEHLREEELRAQLRRTRQHSLVAVSAALLLFAGILFYLFGWVVPYHSYSRDFTKRWGVIYPTGPLSRFAVAHRSWTLQLTRKGWFNPVQSVEVLDANQKLTPNHPMKTYLADWDKVEHQEKPSQYEFVNDSNNKVVYEVARDRFNRKVWTFVHVPVERQDAKKIDKRFLCGCRGIPKTTGENPR